MSSNGADRHLRSNCVAGEMLFGGFVFSGHEKKGAKIQGQATKWVDAAETSRPFSSWRKQNFVPKIRATAFWTILRLVDIL